MAALVAAFALCGYVVESLWLRTTRDELKNASEACALAATRALHTDARLSANPDWPLLRERAASAAWHVANESHVAGDSVPLDVRIGGDVLFVDAFGQPTNDGTCSGAHVST